MDKTTTEQLRMRLIQASLDFMKTISPASYPAFAEVERRKIVNICNASPEMLRDIAFIFDSASKQAAQQSVHSDAGRADIADGEQHDAPRR